jgi:hypothetical protein
MIAMITIITNYPSQCLNLNGLWLWLREQSEYPLLGRVPLALDNWRSHQIRLWAGIMFW